MVNKCKCCGAKYRTNYPHGKKSKGVTTFEKGHSSRCPYKK